MTNKSRNKYVDFVSDEHLLDCVKWVCDSYPEISSEVDLKKLEKNSLDPFKMIFDIINGGITVDQWIKNERMRQSDKTINNKVGEFHQKLLGGVTGWENLGTGNPLGIDLKNNKNTIFIELKNKWNTVKGEDHKNVFDKLKKVLAQNNNALVYYAYIIPKKPGSGEKIWRPSQRQPDNKILETWGARVYEIVTKDITSLEKTWRALPIAIRDFCKTKYQISSTDVNKLIKFFESTFKN